MKLTKSAWIALLALFASCGKPTSSSKPPSTLPIPTNAFIIFHDRTSPVYEWLIIIGPNETFCQHATFPGYANRKQYLLPTTPRTDPACTMPGNLTKPFIPDGPNLMRTTLTETGQPWNEAFFSDNTKALCRFLTSLESEAEKTPPLPAPPPWITEHTFLVPLLGS